MARMKYLVKNANLWNVSSFKAQGNCISKCCILSTHYIYVHAKSNLHNDKEFKTMMFLKTFKKINKVILVTPTSRYFFINFL